jgi:hypothetical protein
MYAIATFVIVAAISMIFTRFATGALIATGLPPEMAGFQARSAFTGAGFTTVEAENVVNQPQRRRIIATTMLVGNLGTPTLIVTVIIGLVGPGPGDTPERLLVTVAGLFVVLALLNLPPVNRLLVRIGENYARRRLIASVGSESLELFEFPDGHVVAEVVVTSTPDLGPRSLRGLDAALGGLRLLGVSRAENRAVLVSEPPADMDLVQGDVLVVFGRREAVASLAGA